MLIRGLLFCLAGIGLAIYLWTLSPAAAEADPNVRASEVGAADASSGEPSILVLKHDGIDTERVNSNVGASSDGYRESYCLWPGDTLADIAAAAGVTVEDILAENPDYTGYAGTAIFLPPGSIPPYQWTTPKPVVNSLEELPFGISGYYIGYDNREKRVALTFDIGYVPENHEFMRQLAEQGIRATFLVIGDPISRYPEVIDHILENGHELGNHSFTHDNMLPHTLNDMGAELRLTEKVVREARADATTKPLFRAPFGAISDDLVQIAADEGYDVMGWTIDSGDWNEDATAEKIYNKVVQNICPGAIVALHDINPASKVALPRILDYLKRNGYTFVTLSEMVYPPQGL